MHTHIAHAHAHAHAYVCHVNSQLSNDAYMYARILMIYVYDGMCIVVQGRSESGDGGSQLHGEAQS